VITYFGTNQKLNFFKAIGFEYINVFDQIHDYTGKHEERKKDNLNEDLLSCIWLKKSWI